MQNVKRQFRLVKARITYAYAKMKAKQLNRCNGKRYYVLMTDHGKLMVMDKDIFYRLRHRGVMPERIKPRMLTKIAVWYTAGMFCGKPSPPMHPKQAERQLRQYLAYIRKGK